MRTTLPQVSQWFSCAALMMFLSFFGIQEGFSQSSNVTRVITDFGGYWNSNSALTTPRPNARHSMLAFESNGTIYSTGANDAVLTANGVGFTAGQFAAFPIVQLPGTTGTGNNAYLTMGKAIDGNPNAANWQSPNIVNLTATDVLTDGLKGLDLGTGVTNVTQNMTLTLSVSDINPAAVTDNAPDIIVTQIADPASGGDQFFFVRADGTRVGNNYVAAFSGVPSVGKYDIDLFTLPANTSYATAKPISNGSAGTGDRDIRIIALRFSQFGINAGNYSEIVGIRWVANGNSDPAFIAYNEESFVLGAPVITTQPVAQTVCDGAAASFSVTATGANLSYQWYQDGSPIPGAILSDYTISSVSDAVAGDYSVEVINAQGSVFSDEVALTVLANPTGTLSASSLIACYGSNVTLTVSDYTGTVQWEGANTIEGPFLPLTGTNTYTTGPLTVNRFYRVQLTDGACAGYSNIVGITVVTDVQWTGAVDTNWHNTGNWFCNVVPSVSDNVTIGETITGNYPVVTTTVAANFLVIGPGASFTMNTPASVNVATFTNYGQVNVNSGSSLSVQSTLTNNGTASNFVIADNANLVQTNEGSNVGAVTVRKNSSLLYRQDYTLWSSPVAGQNLQSFSPVTLATRFYTYTTGTDVYTVVDPSATNFATGQSYLIRMPNQSTVPGYNTGATPIVFEGAFTGVPHNGTLNLTLSTSGNGYNAVGNPYPSAINVADFFAANASSIVDGSALYFWRKKNNATVSSYATLTTLAYTKNNVEGGDTGTGYFDSGNEANWQINPGQGFIVQVDDPTLVFNNSMRRGTNNGQFFRTSQDLQASRYWLNISGGQAFSQMAVGYTPMGTLGLDYALDGKAVLAGSIALYSVEAAHKFAIQARPEFDATDSVTLGFSADAAGTYEISLEQFDGLFANQDIYLHDMDLGIVQDLKEGAYSFATEAGEFGNRFRVIYQSALSVEVPATAAKNVIVIGRNGRIDISSGALQMNTVKIFDVRGRLLHSAVVNANEYSISGIVSDQVLLVQVETNAGIANKKTVLNAQ